MKNVFMLLTLVSLSACSEEQSTLSEQQQQTIPPIQTELATPSNESESDSDKTDWDNAKLSTQQALQDIWNASKESTQDFVEEGSTGSKELWQSSKQKSSELWEQGKESSADIWNEIESGSKSTWSEGKEKVQQFFPEQSEPNNSVTVDEI
ncbi:hypothetical protein GCM10007916_24560 [Psychromonas marina]|uniref:Lipoprotein n=1 Tax=Psychromonas marina TaxID=88364 RepID=A0ABQ6E1R6_9GAMM|nr:hypothetical protein [Psychromonas marina]GLS91387.1 hypothetical protein GCM10007916_24560 [Psychromonas marina]